MDQSIPKGLKISNGDELVVSESGAWVLRSKINSLAVVEANYFVWMWLLLERSFPDVKVALDLLLASGNATMPFPVWKLVGSALEAYGYWMDRAMAWVPFLTVAEKASLKDVFIKVRDSKSASQKNRHLARRFVNDIERSGQDST